MNIEDVKIGMTVIVADGSSYTITKTGAFGVITRVFHPNFADVDFRRNTLTNPGDLTEYTIAIGHLAPYIDNSATAHEILCQKIDSHEMMQSCEEQLRAINAWRITTPLTAENWPDLRDSARFYTGYWVQLENIGHLFAAELNAPLHLKTLHVAKTEHGTQVAFAENEDKHRRDVFSKMRFGRYLAKYFPALDNEAVKKLVAKFGYDHDEIVVQFGETEEEFIQAIDQGPSESCMADLSFKGHIHPAACYAAGDIKVAWLEDGERITARTLINKENKAFSRVYGDEEKLKPALEDMGYSQETGALVGCRLKKIANKEGEGWIMPYVDAGIGSGGGSLKVTDGGDYWMLGTSGDHDTYAGYEGNGVLGGEPDYDYTCDHCGGGVDEDDQSYSDRHDRTLCRHCANRHYTYAAVSRNEHDWVRNEDVVKIGGEWVWDDYADEYAERKGYINAVERGEYIDKDDAVFTIEEEYEHMDDCECVGTNCDGDMFALSSYIVSVRYRDEFWINREDGKPYHENSDEVTEWKAQRDDPDVTEEDGFDSMQFTRSDMVGRPMTEVVCYPEVWAHPSEPEQRQTSCDSQKVLTYADFKVGDRVVLVNKDRAMSGVESVSVGDAGEVCAGNTGWLLVRFDTRPEGTYYCAPYELALQPTAPPKKSWQEVYKEMQAAGIRFELFIVGIREWHDPMMWDFTGTQDIYRIDLSQTPPSNWREIYRKAQADEVDFVMGGCLSDTWVFDDQFALYQLAAAAQ